MFYDDFYFYFQHRHKQSHIFLREKTEKHNDGNNKTGDLEEGRERQVDAALRVGVGARRVDVKRQHLLQRLTRAAWCVCAWVVCEYSTTNKRI